MTRREMASVIDDVSADRLMDYTSNISQWVRLSGSEEERKAFDYIDSTLKSWGLTTTAYSPTCLVSLPISATLTLLDGNESIRCITHSFSAVSNGTEGEVVYLGAGKASDYEGVDVRGKIVLTEGSGNPDKAHAAENTGAIGVINISPREEIREMIISPVWGSPTPDTIDLLPTLPHVTVNGPSGKMLKDKIAEGPLKVHLTAEVETCWKPLPVLVTTIEPTTPLDDSFVLLSGHVDSWHYGAIDNGTANATQLETARVINQHRDVLKRAVRIAFWSGHSHARYATSAWYVDEHFMELRDRCVAHVNIDGPGAKGATDLTQALTMAESFGLAQEVIRELSGQQLEYHRMERMGDQSLWGIGAASFFVSISSPGPNGTMEWHHTPLDTMDYIDPSLLELDGKILAGTVYRLATDSILPLDQSNVISELQGALADISASCGDQFDLSSVIEEAQALAKLAQRLTEHAAEITTDEEAVEYNRVVMKLGRLLMPVNYTLLGPFEQDLALEGAGSLPGLRPAMSLPTLASDAPERFLLETQLRRQRNRLQQALRDAHDLVISYLED